MKVTFSGKPNQVNGKSHRKEKNFDEEYSLLGLVEGKITCLMVIRLYATSARSYCCLWTYSTKTDYTSGSDSASGYGYHRHSAAVAHAAVKAGFQFTEAWDGAGQSKIEEFMMSAGQQIFQVEGLHIHKAHG